MLDIDKLLQKSICSTDSQNDLLYLERDILYKINSKKYNISNRWLDQILDMIFLPKFKLASCVGAIIIGIYFSTSPINNDVYFNSSNQTARNTFEVFSVSSNYLPSTILGN